MHMSQTAIRNFSSEQHFLDGSVHRLMSRFCSCGLRVIFFCLQLALLLLQHTPFLFALALTERSNFPAYVPFENLDNSENDDEKVYDEEWTHQLSKLPRLKTAFWSNDELLGVDACPGAELIEVDATNTTEIINMGRGRALALIQRAGGTRVDYLKLFGKEEV